VNKEYIEKLKKKYLNYKIVLKKKEIA